MPAKVRFLHQETAARERNNTNQPKKEKKKFYLQLVSIAFR